jgi:uncharacterized membrane protein YkvA (DUF1232 family)
VKETAVLKKALKKAVGAIPRPMLPVLAILYLAMPLDVIPDFVPVAGFGDDVAVLAAAAWEVVRRHREGLKSQE